MDKKRPQAKLKRKGSYVQGTEPETGVQSGLELAPAVAAQPSAELPAQPTETTAEPQVFKRSNFKNVVRWFSFLLIVALDIGMVYTTVRMHIVYHKPLTWSLFLKEMFAGFIYFVANCFVLPSIVLEASKVEVTEDNLITRNLLVRRIIPWSSITELKVPKLLKFAIVRTPRWIELINKYEIDRFDDLIQTIRTKTGLHE